MARVTGGGRLAATTAVVTLSSAARRTHVDNQLAVVGAEVLRVVVWQGDDVPSDLDAEVAVRVPPGRHGFRLAAARNAGVDAAVARGVDLVVLLDADCVPGPDLLSRYRDAAVAHGDAILCGPVTYLPPGVNARDPFELARHRSPHAARPAPPPGDLQVATPDQYPLFWSLSFALTAARWKAGPRFDPDYEGYGAEDTDFAFRLRQADVPLVWVGGADAYHQHHPTSSPPVQHLDDILRNGARFAQLWGEWPMTGWLRQFEEMGLVRRVGDGWVTVAGAAK